MLTVVFICILMTVMAYGVMLMLNRQIAVLQAEVNEMYKVQDKHDSRIENCEVILLDTAKTAHKHDQQYSNIIAKQKEQAVAIEKLRGF